MVALTLLTSQSATYEPSWGRGGCNGVQVLWFEKGSASSTSIKEPSQFEFPHFLIFSSSVLVVYKLGSQCSLQTIPHGHPHSMFTSVIFRISSPSIWCFFFFFFKQCTLEVLDLHDNCEEYFHILHNQFPLLPLYISIEHLFKLVNPH